MIKKNLGIQIRFCFPWVITKSNYRFSPNTTCLIYEFIVNKNNFVSLQSDSPQDIAFFI